MDVLRTAILDFCRRKKGVSFCPSEVVRQMFPEDWELFLEEIKAEMIQMHREGLIHVTQNGILVEPSENSKGPFKIIGKSKPK